MRFQGTLRGAKWRRIGVALLVATATGAIPAPTAGSPGASETRPGASLAALAETSAARAPDASAAARAAAEPDPVLAALAVVGGGREARRVRLESERETAEGPGRVTVLVVREGFLDDSVYGDWHRVELSPAPETGGWKIESLSRAIRCRPGRGAEAWRDQRCR